MESQQPNRKNKSNDYQQKSKEGDRKFQELKLPRPQDSNLQLMQRARQLNFGLVSQSENGNQKNIEEYSPPHKLSIPKNNFKCYPNGSPNPYWVDTSEKFGNMIKRIQTCEEFTIDLEMHNYRTKTDFVSLIQIGTWEFGDYLVDPLKVREEIMSTLKPMLESTSILKIGHDLTNDVKWLQTDFGIFMAASVDTQIMYKLLHGDPQLGFQKLATNYHSEMATNFSKETLSDWRLRPGAGMTKEQEMYATNDVHVLLRVFDELRSEMHEKDASRKLFQTAVEDTKKKLLVISGILKDPAPVVDYKKLAVEEHDRLKKLKWFNSSKISDTEEAIFVSLLEWRDCISKIIDDKPHLLLTTEKLLTLCQTKNTTVKNIKMILGNVDKRISDKDWKRAMQAAILQKLIESGGNYIMELRTHQCHNCLKNGHGPAWACPFPKIKENYKAWYQRPENQEFRHYQFQRRKDALVARVGEEAAVKIIQHSKKK